MKPAEQAMLTRTSYELSEADVQHASAKVCTMIVEIYVSKIRTAGQERAIALSVDVLLETQFLDTQHVRQIPADSISITACLCQH